MYLCLIRDTNYTLLVITFLLVQMFALCTFRNVNNIIVCVSFGRRSRQKKDDANVHPDEQTPSYNYGADNAATATDFNDDDNNGDIERQSNNTKPNASEELSEDVKRHSQPPDVVPK